jgi:hypothetical protein
MFIGRDPVEGQLVTGQQRQSLTSTAAAGLAVGCAFG